MSGEKTISVPLKIVSAAESYKAVVVDSKRDKALKGVVMGFLFTMILLTVIPFFIDTYVSGFIEGIVGDASVLFFSSRILVNFVMWFIILTVEDTVDSEKILGNYGIFGIIGLVVAYALAGDVTDAIIPILTIIPAKLGLKF
jgi:hypothetical protein